jgi:tetratricopeptide (TPR) repeat protein
MRFGHAGYHLRNVAPLIGAAFISVAFAAQLHSQVPGQEKHACTTYLVENSIDYYAIDPPAEVVAVCDRLLKDAKDIDQLCAAEIRLRRAHAYLNLDNYEAASRDYDAAANILPKDPRVVLGQAWVVCKKDPKKGGLLFQELAASHPGFARGHWALAKWQYDGEDYQSVENSCTRALAAPDARSDVPLQGELLLLRASARYGLQRWQATLDDLNRSIELLPFLGGQTDKRYELRLEALFRLRAYDRLEFAARAVTQLKQDHARARYMWWLACIRQGKYETALHLAERFVEHRFGDVGGCELLCASTATMLGRFPEALDHAKRAEEVHAADSRMVWKEMALAYEGLHEYGKAARYYERALEGDRRRDLLLARAFFLVNCPDEKIRDAKEAERLAVAAGATSALTDWRCELVLAQAWAAQGKRELAVKATETALKVDSLPIEAKKELEGSLKAYRDGKSYRSTRNYGVQGW